MKNIDLRKTLKLSEFNIGVRNIITEWKIVIPLIISLTGTFFGTFMIKGEGGLYGRTTIIIENYLLKDFSEPFYICFIIYLLIPTVFAVIMFFLGLSVYGGIIVSILPFSFAFFSGIITYYMYSVYTLKGLAYCVIMMFPYSTLVLFALIKITSECITMSQYILCTLSVKRRKIPDYSINKYYVNSLKSYLIIIIAALIKTGIESLFVGLFSF